MAHYAFLDKNNIVTSVIVGKDEDPNIDWEQHYSEITGYVCKRTSYNTYGGTHLFNGTPYRKNYAGAGYIFREDINYPEGAFVPPQPSDNHILDENTCTWVEVSTL